MKKHTRKLVATYKSSDGKHSRFTYKNPTTDKSSEEIKEMLELLTLLDIFERDGVNPFEEVISAKYVETIETPIFDISEEEQSETGDENFPNKEPGLEESTPEIPAIPEKPDTPNSSCLSLFNKFSEVLNPVHLLIFKYPANSSTKVMTGTRLLHSIRNKFHERSP